MWLAEDEPHKDIIPYFIMTRIRFIDRYMLFWPLLTGLLIHVWGKSYRSNVSYQTHRFGKIMFFRNFLSKGILNYMVFKYPFYNLFNFSFEKFDTSGHVSCALFAYASWVSLVIYLLRYKDIF